MIGPRRLKFLIASVRQNLDAGTGLPSAIFLNPNDDFTFACEFFVLVVGFFTVLSRGGVHHPLPLYCCRFGSGFRSAHAIFLLPPQPHALSPFPLRSNPARPSPSPSSCILGAAAAAAGELHPQRTGGQLRPRHGRSPPAASPRWEQCFFFFFLFILWMQSSCKKIPKLKKLPKFFCFLDAIFLP